MVDGIFRDAHEVYGQDLALGIEWRWVATFCTKDLADQYVRFNKRAEENARYTNQEWEVRPV